MHPETSTVSVQEKSGAQQCEISTIFSESNSENISTCVSTMFGYDQQMPQKKELTMATENDEDTSVCTASDLQESERPKIRKFEDLLTLVGTHGTWQISILILLITQAALAVIHVDTLQFILDEPEHWCSIPELENANWTKEQIQNVAVPTVKTGTNYRKSSCHMFDKNYTDIVNKGYSIPEAPVESEDNSSIIISCTDWKFDKVSGTETIVSEWNLVCSANDLKANVKYVFYAGSILGAFFGGIISDKCGRRVSILSVMIVWTLSGIMSTFVPTYEWFILFKFLNGFGAIGTYVVGYTLMMETVTPNVRASWATYYDMGANFGTFLITGVAFTFRDWRYLHIITSIPCIILLLVYWKKLPESPRWLILKGKYDKAEKVLDLALTKNEKALDQSQNLKCLIIGVHRQIIKRQKSAPLNDDDAWANVRCFCAKVSHIFKNRLFLFSVICMSFEWFVASFINHGISDLSQKLEIETFTITTLSAAVSVVVRLVMHFPLDHFGRRATMCIGFIVAGIAILSSGFVPKSLPGVTLMLLLVSLICSYSLITAIYLITAELFPTEIRTFAIAVGAMWDNAGEIAAPFAVEAMAECHYHVPNIMIFLFATAVGIASMWLPETRHKSLCETTGDIAEQKRWKINNMVTSDANPVKGTPIPLEPTVNIQVQTDVL